MVDDRLLQHWTREQAARAQARAASGPTPEMGHVLHAFLQVARKRTILRVVTGSDEAARHGQVAAVGPGLRVNACP